jgi:hypothetical protein
MLMHRGRRISAIGFGSAVALVGALGVLAAGTSSASAQSLAGSWAGGMPRGDIIIVFPEDNSFYAQFLVVEVGKQFVKVVKTPLCFELKDEDASSINMPEGYSIKLRGPRKWSVLRGTVVIKEDVATRSAAEAWFSDHLKAMAA